MKRWMIATILLITGLAHAQTATSMKFENGGLKDRTVVEIMIKDSTLSGTYSIERDYEAATAEKYSFTAIKPAPDKMEVTFSGGKIPYDLPKGATKPVWQFKGKQLVIPTQGMNHETKAISNYDMAFDAVL